MIFKLIKKHLSNLINPRTALAFIGLGLVSVGIAGLNAQSAQAVGAAGINQTINYQGRLLNAAGAVIADGTYNMEFKIYQDGDGCVSGGTSPCSGTLKWTEDWINSGTDKRVVVKNGYFSVNLGSVTAFGGSVNWNWDTLWLTQTVASGNPTGSCTPFSTCNSGNEPEMLPMKRLSSAVYALNSQQLGGLTAGQYVQLAQGVQADSSTTNPSIFINKTGATANILELQKAGGDVLTVNNAGATTLQNSTDSATGFLVKSASGSLNASVFDVDTLNQRIGVNTNAPSDTFQINQGTTALPGTVSNSASSPNVTGSATTFTTSFLVGDTFTVTSTTNTCTILSITDNTHLVCTGNLSTLSSNSAYTMGNIGRIGVLANGSLGVGTTSPTQSLQVTDAGGNTAFSVDTRNLRVGIGTANPTNRFTVNGGNSLFTNTSTTSTTPTLSVTTTATPTTGNTITSLSNTLTNTPTSVANTAIGQAVTVTDATTLANTLQGFSLVVSDTGTGAKVVRGLSVDTTGTTNGSAAVTTALFKAATSTTAFQVQNTSSQAILAVDTSANVVAIGGTQPTVQSASGNLTVLAQGTNQLSLDTGSTGTVVVGSSNAATVTIGNSNTATNVTGILGGAGASGGGINIGGGTNAQTVNIGSTVAATAVNIQGGSTGGINIGTSGSPTITIGNSATTTKMGGRVGVGTAAPTEQLDVEGQLPSATIGSAFTTGNPAYDVATEGQYAYTASYGKFDTWDVTRPSAPVKLGTLSISTGIVYVKVSGKYAFVVNGTTSQLYIINISNPASPSLTATVGTSVTVGTLTQLNTVAIQGRYMYLGASTVSNNYVLVYDISNPATPQYVANVIETQGVDSIAIQGTYLYATIAATGLQIVDISNPAAPVNKGSLSSSSTNTVIVQGRYAYLSLGTTLQAVNVSDPTAPVSAGTVTLDSSESNMVMQGKYIYVAISTSHELQVVNVSNPASMSITGTIATGTEVRSVALAGNYAYVSDYTNGKILVYDMGGAYIQQLQAGGIAATTLDVSNSLQVEGAASFSNGLRVNQGFSADGNSSVQGSFQVQNASGTTVLNADATQGTLTTNGGSLTINGIANPAAPTLTSSSTGGSLAANTYFYRLDAVGTGGSGTTAGIPSSPGSVTTSGSASQNTLSWTAVPNATAYDVYRSIDGGNTWFYNQFSSATTSIIDNGSTYTWATSGSFSNFSNAGGINLQKSTGITFDAGSGGTYQMEIFDNVNGGNTLTMGNYNAGGSVDIQGQNFYLTDTSTYNHDFSMTNTGAITLKNSVNSSAAFQVQNSSGASLLGVNTLTSNLNLVANPSFEVTTNGWSLRGAATVTYDDAAGNALYGGSTLKMVNTASGDGAKYSYPLLPSQQYSLSMWAKASVATTMILGRQENGSDVETGCVAASVTTSWTQVTCTFTTGATINTASNIYIRQTVAGTPTVYLDGVMLVTGATVQSYVAPSNNLQVDAGSSNLTLNNANTGELQSWRQTNAMGTGRRYASTVTANGYIYYIGGCTGACSAGLGVTTVDYAKINADGSVGTTTWSTTTALPQARYGHTAFTLNGYLYVVGGDNATGALNAAPQTTVYYSRLNQTDGTLGSWQTSANSLLAAREFHTSVTANGYAYVIGGDNAGAQSTAYYAKLYSDGSTAAWATTTPLSTGAAVRREADSVVANGYVYVIGGDSAGTAQSTVYYNSLNADGTLGASWASTTALPQIRRYETTVTANGYIYAIGGDNGSGVATNTVYYAAITAGGLIGSWFTNGTTLPAARWGQSTMLANGYVYALSGYDGSNPQPTVYYASTSRVMLGGSLDLVGLNSQTLTDPGGAGSIVAGNIRAVGALQVEGFADFNTGLAVASGLTINTVGSSAGQTILNANDSSGNSIFGLKYLAGNFGAFASAGAFVSKNNYWGEEFNVTQTNVCSRTTTTNGWKARGDFGSNGGTACTPGDGELAFSSVLGVAASGNTSAACTSNSGACGGSLPAANYGLERISAVSTITASNTAASLEYIATNAAGGTASGLTAANNLPVFTAKVKPSLTASGSNARFFVGLGDKGVASGLFPNNGVFFSNCTATAVPACAGTNWIGVVTSASAVVGTVTCNVGLDNSNNINTVSFNYLRIEVRSNTDYHFFVDTDTSNGVNEKECGSGISGTGPGATGLSPMLETAFMTATATTENMDVDFVRIWQDDPPAGGQQAEVLQQSGGGEAPLVPDVAPGDRSGWANSPLVDFTAATNEDTIFDHDVYVKGTLYADKIKANQIEGLDVLTNSVDSLQAKLAASGQPAGPALPSAPLASPGVNLNGLKIDNGSVSADMNVKGGLTVGGAADFQGSAFFRGLVTFVQKTVFNNDVSFEGRPTFNSDTAGYATIYPTQQEVSVKFDRPYDQTPVVVVSLKNGLFEQFSYKDATTTGFTIVLPKAATEELDFSWYAVSVKDAKTTALPTPSPSVSPRPSPALSP